MIDFPATVYELTGIRPGYDHLGRSLLPLLADEKKEHREAVVCEGSRLYGEEQALEDYQELKLKKVKLLDLCFFRRVSKLRNMRMKMI